MEAAKVANLERRLPPSFIADDGMQISEAGRRYLAPLIAGECPVRCADGLPAHDRDTLPCLPRKLAPYSGWAEELIYARG